MRHPSPLTRTRTTLFIALPVALGACSAEEAFDAADRATGVPATNSTGTRPAWVDPLVTSRMQARPRQRVLVELVREDEGPRLEAPDEPRARSPRPSLSPSRRLALRTRKEGIVQRLDATTPDTVDVVHWYPPFAVVALDATPTQILELARLDTVARIHADREERPALGSSLPAVDAPWFHTARGSGEGTAVAVLDSPVRYDNGHFGSCPSPGASGCAVAAFESFSPQSPQEVIAFEDANGKGSHGTNVAAIVHGVAPDARLLALNVFYWNEEAEGMRSRVSDQLDALAWVADHAAQYDIVAVNMSIGGDPEGPATCNDISRYDAVRTLWDDHGVLTVVSSGNDGESNAIASPGCISMAVTVGAHFDTELDDYDGSCEQVAPRQREIACFSNLSGMVDLLAPGVYVDAGGYVKSGTSMAAPHVAGAVAAWQSWFLEDEGSFKSPFWMHKRLLMQSSAPHVHTDGRRYQRLDFGESVQWDSGRSFPYWFRESSGNEIPSNGSFFETSLEVSGGGFTVQSAYLVLDVAHERPEHLDIRVQSPDGHLAMLELPAGQAHFSGVIGRTVEPGALTNLAGSQVDGSWTLRIRDTVGTHDGHYLQGALYFVKQGCSPSCEGTSCGDDTCGGSCGAFCLIDGACFARDETQPGNTCRSCIPGVSDTSFTAVEGKTCDDGDGCTLNDRCTAGVCGGEDRTCPAPGACETSLGCNPDTGGCAYDPLPDGTSCSDDDACTTSDACVDGRCEGAPITCTPSGPCQRQDGCEPSTGQCVFVDLEDGASCPGGTCRAGACVPTGSAPPGDGGTLPQQQDAASPDEGGGCGCRLEQNDSRGVAWLAAALAALTLAHRRRKRSG